MQSKSKAIKKTGRETAADLARQQVQKRSGGGGVIPPEQAMQEEDTLDLREQQLQNELLMIQQQKASIPPVLWQPNETGFTYQAPARRSTYVDVSTNDLSDPTILTGTRGGAAIRYVDSIRDKTLRQIPMTNPQAQASLKLLGDPTYSNYLVSLINQSGIKVRVDAQGLIYTYDGNPIDSKKAKKKLYGIPEYRKPETIQQYRAKAAIRFAQNYNKMIRALYQNQKMDNGALQMMWDNVQANRIKRENTPANIKAARAIRQIMKKYDGLSLTDALKKRDAKIAAFQADQQAKIDNKTQYLAQFLK